jgi:beta-lactamase superfamily II metal-dependent hydrolase
MFASLPLWLSLLSFSTPAAETRCVKNTFAQRTGSEKCWVEFQLDARRALCLDHRSWLRWLSAVEPAPICETISAPWNVYSSRQNSRLDFPPTPKTIRLSQIQRIDRLPVSKNGIAKCTILSLIRQKIELFREKISDLLRPRDRLGILRSLLLNERTPQNHLALFRQLGFVHLISSTGIHLYALSRANDQILRSLTFYFRVPIFIGLWVSRVSSFIFCLAIWLLGGARLGMLRPWFVLLLRAAARNLGFQWKKGSPLFLAIAIDLVAAFYRAWKDHEPIQNTGRWFYALAVGGGLFWRDSFSSAHLGLAIGSWLGVALWEAWETGIISLATPVLSLITLPLTCVLVYPLLLFCILLHCLGTAIEFQIGATWAIDLISKSLEFLTLKLSAIVLHPGNLWLLTRPSLLAGSCIATLVIIVITSGIRFGIGSHDAANNTKFREIKVSTIVILVLLSLRYGANTMRGRAESVASATPPGLPHSTADSVEQLDVGQGDAAIVLNPLPTNSSAGLIDSGSEKTTSDEAWLKIFAKRNISRLSWVGLTHLDEDHAGGLLRLAQLIPIGCVAAPAGELKTARGEKLSSILAKFGLKLSEWNGGCIPYPTLEIHPPRSGNAQNENMGAVWIPLKLGGFYLSAGDANAEQEREVGNWAKSWMLLRAPNNRVRILKVSHHGSRYSTDLQFLAQIQPTQAWISAGINNRYGHPAVPVLKKLEALQIPIYRTDRDGAIRIKN